MNANITSITDADTEASYRATFTEKLDAARNGMKQENACVKCQTELNATRINREIDESTSSEIDEWLRENKSTIVDSKSEESYLTTFTEKINAAKAKLIAAQEQRRKEIEEENARQAAEYARLRALEEEKVKWAQRRLSLKDECRQELRYAQQQGEIGWEAEEVEKWYPNEAEKVNTEDDVIKFKSEFKQRCDAARAEMSKRLAIRKCCDACLSAVKNSKLSYKGQERRENDVHKFFGNGRQQEKSDGSSDAVLTLATAEEYKEKLTKELDALAALPTSTDETVLRAAATNEDLDSTLRSDVAKQLVSLTTDIQLLMSLYEGDMKRVIDYSDRRIVPLRLAELSESLSDTNVIVSLLKNEAVVDSDKREKLVSRLPDDVRVSYVLRALDWCGVHDWNENKIQAFDDALAALKFVKEDSAVKIVSCIAEKFADYEEQCRKSWTMSWSDEDQVKIQKIVGRFPKFDDATLEKLVSADEVCWTCVSNGISEAVAYSVLSSGKAKSGDLEILLAKTLPEEKIDMKVYRGAKFAVGKKALYDRMSPSMKGEAERAMEADYMEICIRAKSAAKKTFEHYGFYLGMSFDDAKKVLAYHFPDLKTREEIDGRGNNADHALYIEGQTTPLCFAKISDQKVWLFNFGKRLLKKWYDFDTQTYLEWATMYGDKTKSDMRLKMVEDKTTVYESDMSNSYTVWFHQESYQYRNNKKRYLLTYFGEERDYTVEDGLGGEVLKSMAAKDFRYVRGDPGSLRVRAVKDE